MAVFRKQLFAAIPSKYKASFETELYGVNSIRFMAQSLIVAIMDLFSLAAYLILYLTQGELLPAHVAVHIVKIIVMLACMMFFAARKSKFYRPNSFLDRNASSLYPLLHLCGEFLLYASGPNDLGGSIRFLAVPFVVGGIPILRQLRAFLLLTANYVLYISYLTLATPYQAQAVPHGILVNVLLVVFPCASLISFTVYSWSVNKHVASAEAEEAHQKLATANTRLSYLSCHDQLTGMLNRRGLQEELEQTWEAAIVKYISATAIMFDIDFFKQYNDRFGHLAGDNCLVKVTAIIRRHLKDEFILVRYGGEEFLAFSFLHTHQRALEISQQIRCDVESLKMEHPDSTVSPYVTISGGVATQRISQLRSYDSLVNMADECLYFAKNNGRNQIVETYNQKLQPRTKSPAASESAGPFDEEHIQRVLKEISADCTFVYNARTQRLTFSDLSVELFGMPNNIVCPSYQKLAEYVPLAPAEKKPFFSMLKQSIEDRKDDFSHEVHILPRDGTETLVSIRAQFVYSEDGDLEVAHGAFYSTEKIFEYNHYLQQQSMTNSITLLPNRQKLYQDAEKLLSKPEGSGHLVLIDINDFKDVNSTYSHNIGDKVLRKTAESLSLLVKPFQVYSYNVDQYVVVAPECAKEDSTRLMEEIQHYFYTHMLDMDGLKISIRLSIIAVDYQCQKTQADELMVDLDIAIQLAKYNSQASYSYLTDQARNDYMAKLNLGHALKQAVDESFRGFRMFYQPIFSAESKCLVGAEALLRWFDDSGEIVPPQLVVPVLEKSGLMPLVEEWIFSTVCTQCRRWLNRGVGDDFFININLSSSYLSRPTLQAELHTAMDAAYLDHKHIVLEATETVAILQRETAVNTLAQLQEKGYTIAIDDFGTGYSSLSYLGSLPADEIKIDRSFVQDIHKNPSDLEFLLSIIGMAKSMNYKVCVEGVENLRQCELLAIPQVDFLQGFYLGTPVPEEQFLPRYQQSLKRA